MVMMVYGQEVPCVRAEKGADFIRAYDENGVCVFSADRVSDFTGYVIVGGEWSEAEPTTAEQVAALETALASTQSAAGIVFAALAESGGIGAETAVQHPELFEAWTYPADYKTGNIRRHGGTLYRCLQDHTSQETWTPDAAPSLWARVDDPAEEWPEWVQPTGSTDAYAKGAKVSHNGRHWISDADSNVWEPGVYGWTEANGG